MEDGFKTLLFGFILMSLFGLLLLTAVMDAGNTYEKDTTQIIGAFNFSQFNNTVNEIEENAENLQTQFSKQSTWSAVVGIVTEGIFGIALKMVKIAVLVPFDIMSNILLNVFYVPPFVSAVILGLLMLSIIFGIWRLLKVGD